MRNKRDDPGTILLLYTKPETKMNAYESIQQSMGMTENILILSLTLQIFKYLQIKINEQTYGRKRNFFLSYSFIGGKVLND